MAIELSRIERLYSQSNFHGVRWGGIFVGVVVTVSLIFMFSLLGGTIGLASIDVIDPIYEESYGFMVQQGRAAPVWSWVFYLITGVSSFLVGGYCSTLAGGARTPRAGLICGLSTWAVVVVSMVTLGSLFTPVFIDLISGTGPSSSNALIFSTLAFGIPFSIWGGKLGVRKIGSDSAQVFDKPVEAIEILKEKPQESLQEKPPQEKSPQEKPMEKKPSIQIAS